MDCPARSIWPSREFEESEREMLAAGHNDQARLLNADANLVSPPQCFVGQLLKDRPASSEKRLRDLE
jgi:hypothetical protein